MGSPSEAYRRPIGVLSEAYRRPIGGLLEFYRRPIGGQSEAYRSSIGGLSEAYRRPIGGLSEAYRSSIGGLSEAYRRASCGLLSELAYLGIRLTNMYVHTCYAADMSSFIEYDLLAVLAFKSSYLAVCYLLIELKIIFISL